MNNLIFKLNQKQIKLLIYEIVCLQSDGSSPNGRLIPGNKKALLPPAAIGLPTAGRVKLRRAEVGPAGLPDAR